MGAIVTEPALSQAVGVFEDRGDAGLMTAKLLLRHFGEDALENAAVVAIPAGGVPVGLVMAQRLGVPFDLIFIRKLHFPYNPEAGFGAVTEHGVLMINEALAAHLSRKTLERVIADMQAAAARLRDATYVFHKQEYADGERQPAERIRVKYRAPGDIYMKWLGPVHAGRELLYRDY